MLIRTPLSAALTLLAAGCISLAGCSTGGSNATVTHTPALNTAGGRDTARSGTQVAILAANTSNGIALPGGPIPAAIARRIFAMRGLRPSATGTATGACTNGVKQSQKTNPDGSTTTTTDYYFDAACATLETEEIINLANTSASASSGTGTITAYDRSGATRVVETLTFNSLLTAATATTPANESVTLSFSAAPSASAAATAQVGATCTGTPGTPNIDCSAAHNGSSAGVGFADAFTSTGTAGTAAGTSSASISVGFYLGPNLGISQSGNAWGVNGASAFNSASATYTFTTTGSTGQGTLSLKDVLYTYTETATLSSSGLAVNIVENPNGIVTVVTPIATATIDPAGEGVLNYADGSSEPIAGGLIGF